MTENGYTLSIGLGTGHYCDNHALMSTSGMDSSFKPTATMEVAIMDSDHEFVVLPHDVAAYVPCGNLGSLIEAVESTDWDLVKKLCAQ